jgi:hypothetical protein
MLEAVAEYSGLHYVRVLDRLAVMRRVTQTAYQLVDIPRIAAEQTTRVIGEFAEYLNPAEKKDVLHDRLTRLFTTVMKLNNELLISAKTFKIAFIPPGTAFDPKIMQAINSKGDVYRVREADVLTLRVNICLWPVLVAFDEEGFPEAETHGQDYRRALLNSREWCSAAGDGAIWEKDGAEVTGLAVVVV